jgi:hypothetical protein
MTSTTTSTAVPSVDQAEEDAACTSCPHPLAAHDAISVRFCRATAGLTGGTTTRGCVCPSS